MTPQNRNDERYLLLCRLLLYLLSRALVHFTAVSLITSAWSESIGLRTGLVPDQKYGLSLGLAGVMLSCESRFCYARRHNDLEGHSNFSSRLLIFVSLLCALNIGIVDINSGIH